MTRQSSLIGVAFILSILCGASKSVAILNCTDCGCSFACTTRCVTDTGFSTCGAVGSCSTSTSCGGPGCLIASDPNAFLASLQAEPGQAASSQQGLVLARLTWRMAQHVEEGGLGAVYAGNTGFLVSKAIGRVKAPALAFVSREHLQAGSAWSGAPDLAVELRAAAARDWLQAGTHAVLVLDTGAKTVSLYQRSGKVVRQAKLGASCRVRVPAGKGLTTHPYRVLQVCRRRAY